MEKEKLIEKSHKDFLGKYFFKKAVSFAVKNKYGTSYEYFKEGLDIVTCDCIIGGWLDSYKEIDEVIFNDINVNHIPEFEYHFVKAYILSFESDKKSLYLALDSVDKYINSIDDEYGFYVKGKILLHLEKPKDALDAFKAALNYRINSRILYRIGRTKEQYLQMNGLDELYNSLMANPLSPCCNRVLAKYSQKHNIKLPLIENKDNKLLNSFNSKNTSDTQFNSQFIFLLRKYSESKGNPLFSLNKESKELKDFIDQLRNNAELFVNGKFNESSLNEFSPREREDYSSYDEPIQKGDPRYDRNENPWIDVFGPGEEAETAYWNTD